MGKSLSLDVLETIYLGNKKMLEKTWIVDPKNVDCPTFKADGTYPVIRFEPPSVTTVIKDLADDLNCVLLDEAERHRVFLDASKSPSTNFRRLIEKVSEKKGNKQDNGKVVILIDEFDKPMMGAVKKLTDQDFKTTQKNEYEEVEYVTSVMHDLYEILKSKEKKIKKCFIVGSGKFAKHSVFSAFNNFVDISEHPHYAALFGITKEEVYKDAEIMKYIELIALRREFETGIATTSEQIIGTLLEYYDGFQFSESQSKRVFSPYSLLCYLKNATVLEQRITNEQSNLIINPYWFSSGTPTPLMYAAENYPLSLFSSLQVLGSHSIEKARLETSCTPEEYPAYPYLQLYQSGYLTIDKLDYSTMNYILRFPNREVKDAWENGIKKYRDRMFTKTIADALNQRNWKEVDIEIQNLLEKHTLQLKENKFFYHSVFFGLLRHNMDIRDYCEGKQNLASNAGYPDVIYGHIIDEKKCLIVVAEFIWDGADPKKLADNAVARDYISKIKKDTLVKSWVNGKEVYYYTLDFVLKEGKCKSMRVREDGNKELCVFKRDSEGIASRLPRIERVVAQNELPVLKSEKQLLNLSYCSLC
eukprot:TRINITY_DN5625_c0_g1_i1.p1 TRINITY_DN5625_c0_g1~~TRINITY_DN5625_c0_g1_i1.p1  ORF type:complete len:646 (+),score=79.58 TRINITY_DN5625_c0_g1_i1:179-1939(+)